MPRVYAMIVAASLSALVLASNVCIPNAWAQTASSTRVSPGAILQMNGVTAGLLRAADGGYATSSVVFDPIGSDHVQRKHLSGLKYDDLVFSTGTGMTKTFYEAVKTMVAGGKFQRFDGVVTHPGASKARSFSGGYFSEVTFPGLAAASQEQASLMLRITPETTRIVPAAVNIPATAIDPKIQKKWLKTNFRMTIKGLEAACQKIMTIEPISIKFKPAASSAGSGRDSAVSAGVTTYSDLVVTFPEADGDAFVQWFDSFVFKGVNGDAQEKEGSLEFLTPNLQEVLFTLTFGHIGIYRLTTVPMDANSTVRRLKAEMYVETIVFDYKASWA